MRRRSITAQTEIDEIISKCQVCHLSMVDEQGMPYVIPMNFGYHEGTVYMHTGPHGRKLDILRHRPGVCLAFSTDYMLRYQNEEVACSWGMKYRSLLLFGNVEFIEDNEEKTGAMNIIMRQYAGRDYAYNMPAIREVVVFRLKPGLVTGRAYGY